MAVPSATVMDVASAMPAAPRYLLRMMLPAILAPTMPRPMSRGVTVFLNARKTLPRMGRTAWNTSPREYIWTQEAVMAVAVASKAPRWNSRRVMGVARTTMPTDDGMTR